MAGLGDELTALEKHTLRWGRINFTLAEVFFWIAILASFATTLVAAADSSGQRTLTLRITTAALAAIPGLVILIDRRFSFGRRSQWFYLYRVQVRRLRLDLAYGKHAEEIVAEKLGLLELEMERLWSQVVGGTADDPGPSAVDRNASDAH
jgi:hypothetical protein